MLQKTSDLSGLGSRESTYPVHSSPLSISLYCRYPGFLPSLMFAKYVSSTGQDALIIWVPFETRSPFQGSQCPIIHTKKEHSFRGCGTGAVPSRPRDPRTG